MKYSSHLFVPIKFYCISNIIVLEYSGSNYILITYQHFVEHVLIIIILIQSFWFTLLFHTCMITWTNFLVTQRVSSVTSLLYFPRFRKIQRNSAVKYLSCYFHYYLQSAHFDLTDNMTTWIRFWRGRA